jgi:acetolactate synthase-1/2/3 large subunit
LNALLALRQADRPLFVFGCGIRLAGAQEVARRLVELTGVPVVTTWGAADMFPGSVGSFGTHGVRAANFAVQTADLLVCVGTRLDTKATGSPASSFAPKAKIIMVDIDQAELDKMEQIGRPVEKVCRDAKEFLTELHSDCVTYATHDINTSTWGYREWSQKIQGWREKYPPGEVTDDGKINPYQFVRHLGEKLTSDDVIVSDTGCVLGWMMQAYPFKGERFVHAFNQTPMGYGLPGAVGAAFATGKRVVLVTGDGGLSVNITELATVARHQLPIKVLVFNNRGHAMCRQTQRQWLKGEYPATSEEGGLACPDYRAVAQAYGLTALQTSWADAAQNMLAGILNSKGPAFLELEINPDHGIEGQIKFGEPLADLQEAA